MVNGFVHVVENAALFFDLGNANVSQLHKDLLRDFRKIINFAKCGCQKELQVVIIDVNDIVLQVIPEVREVSKHIIHDCVIDAAQSRVKFCLDCAGTLAIVEEGHFTEVIPTDELLCLRTIRILCTSQQIIRGTILLLLSLVEAQRADFEVSIENDIELCFFRVIYDLFTIVIQD